MKARLLAYLKNNKHYWWTVGILPGLYAISYLYTKNYTLVNSWRQLIGFIIGFIIVPSMVMVTLHYVFKNKNVRFKNWLYTTAIIINTSITLSLVVYLGWRWKALILVAIIAAIASWYAGKHYKKGVILLGFMTLLSLAQFTYFFFSEVYYKKSWVKQSDISSIRFVKKPNIYFIQPDGYASKPALANKNYAYNNYAFYEKLEAQGFIFNHQYRSNYPSTLTSNATLFTGQHHYYDHGNLKNELFNARQIIMGLNPVLEAFKNNGYQTTAVLQHRYLLLNNPNIAYNRLNIEQNDLSLFPNYYLDKDYFSDLKKAITTASNDPQFYFIEILEPGHITGLKVNKTTVKQERDNYIKDMKNVSLKLYDMISYISKKDPTAIIIIAADHGGFVGYNYTGECYESITHDSDLRLGIFGALFTIKAPEDFANYGKNIQSSVSLFPQLFQYLSNQPVIEQDIDNSSYQLIENGKQRGVYKYYDGEGNVVTEKLELLE